MASTATTTSILVHVSGATLTDYNTAGDGDDLVNNWADGDRYAALFVGAGASAPLQADVANSAAWIRRIHGGLGVVFTRATNGDLVVSFFHGNAIPLLWPWRYIQIVKLPHGRADFYAPDNVPMITMDFGTTLLARWNGTGAAANAFGSLPAGNIISDLLADGLLAPGPFTISVAPVAGQRRAADIGNTFDGVHTSVNLGVWRDSRAEFGLREVLDAQGVMAQPIEMQLVAPAGVTNYDATPLSEDPTVSAPALRTVGDFSIAMAEPAVVRGLPYSPRWWARNRSLATTIEGLGHIRVGDTVDPVYDPVNHVWLVAPPAGGAGDLRWTTKTLPAPAPDQRLGEPSAYDFTGPQPAAFDAWASAPSPSPLSAPLQSFWPFRPQVVDYDHYTATEKFHIGTAVQLDHSHVEHLFVEHDFTGDQTWIFVALIPNYPSLDFSHPLLDTGQDLRAYQSFPGPVVPSGEYVPELADFPAPKVAMEVSSSRQLARVGVPPALSTTGPRGGVHELGGSGAVNLTPSLRSISAEHDAVQRPKMYVGRWDGASSFVGNYSVGGVKGQLGYLNAPERTAASMVIGRRAGWRNAANAADLLLFEVRYFARALTFAEIQAQYDQLATTWRFARYG